MEASWLAETRSLPLRILPGRVRRTNALHGPAETRWPHPGVHVDAPAAQSNATARWRKLCLSKQSGWVVSDRSLRGSSPSTQPLPQGPIFLQTPDPAASFHLSRATLLRLLAALQNAPAPGQL